MAFVAWTPAPFRLANQQWNAIRKAGGLPDAARADIEAALGDYKEFCPFARALQSIPKRKLRRIEKLADQLVAAVIGKNPDTRAKLCRLYERDFSSGETATVMALELAGRHYTSDHKRLGTLAGGLRREAFAPRQETKGEGGAPWPPSPLPQVYGDDDAIQLLFQCCWHVEQLRFCAERAARVQRGTKTRVHVATLSTNHLIRLLDGILSRYTGDFINRSYKQGDLRRCVELCFGAVNSKVGSGSIDKAIQAHVSQRLYLTEEDDDDFEAALDFTDERAGVTNLADKK
jgi:hypothetical protein